MGITKQRYSGAVALTTVIIVSGILLAAGVTLVLTSIDLRKVSSGYYQMELARIRSRSCLEDAVYRLKYTPNFTGTFTILFPDGECEGTVTNGASSNLKVINFTGVIGSYSYTDSKQLDINSYPFQLSDL